MTLSHSLITLWADGLVKWPRTYLLSFWSRWEPANMSHFSWIRAQIYPMRPNCLCTLDLFPRKDLWRKYYFVKLLKEESLGKTFFFFKVLDDYTKSDGLEWTRCVGGGCSDGATAMTVKISGVTALIKQKAPDVVATHCEALVAKMMDNKLNQVLQEVIQVVNFIKALPMTHRLFTMLCKMRWAPILRGCCFTRMCTGCHGAQF